MAEGQVLLPWKKVPLSQEIGNPHVCHGRGFLEGWRRVVRVSVRSRNKRVWPRTWSTRDWRADPAEPECRGGGMSQDHNLQDHYKPFQLSEDHKQFQSYSVPSENWRGKVHSKTKMDIPFVNGSNGSAKHAPLPLVNGEQYPSTSASNISSLAYALRPKRIILVRHGQSEGNVDESAYTRIPDSKIALTEEGWNQAIRCGKKMRAMIESDEGDDWKVYFYVSPYKRTLQTLRGIGLAFERDRIAGVREEPRLREQDFGNFQDREKMREEKAVRLRYGRFFYRFPNGESAADVYDRITGVITSFGNSWDLPRFRETLRADIDVGRFQRPEARSENMNLVLVSHGLTLRVFLMRWYKWTVEQFEGLWNFGNTGMMVMELGPGGRYSLSMHHTHEELRSFGMTEEMIADQEWQKLAKPGELNRDWLTSGSSFFTHFDDLERGIIVEDIPPDIVRTSGIIVEDIPPDIVRTSLHNNGSHRPQGYEIQ